MVLYREDLVSITHNSTDSEPAVSLVSVATTGGHSLSSSNLISNSKSLFNNALVSSLALVRNANNKRPRSRRILEIDLRVMHTTKSGDGGEGSTMALEKDKLSRVRRSPIDFGSRCF